MTPEELNRTIKFIIASQARLAAAQEHDRLEFKKWSKSLFSKISDLADLQSQRMDRMDKIYQAGLAQGRELLDLQQQAIRLLNMILDRFPKPERPN